MNTATNEPFRYPGQLLLAHDDGRGMQHWKCITCSTLYPRRSGGSITCNGHNIGMCPWCRKDSKPWKHGRGV